MRPVKDIMVSEMLRVLQFSNQLTALKVQSKVSEAKLIATKKMADKSRNIRSSLAT